MPGTEGSEAEGSEAEGSAIGGSAVEGPVEGSVAVGPPVEGSGVEGSAVEGSAGFGAAASDVGGVVPSDVWALMLSLSTDDVTALGDGTSSGDCCMDAEAQAANRMLIRTASFIRLLFDRPKSESSSRRQLEKVTHYST